MAKPPLTTKPNPLSTVVIQNWESGRDDGPYYIDGPASQSLLGVHMTEFWTDQIVDANGKHTYTPGEPITVAT